MHQIRFRLELRPKPRWGSSQRSPDPLVAFRGPTSKGREGEGGEGKEKGKGKGRERERERREGKREGRGRPFLHCSIRPYWGLIRPCMPVNVRFVPADVIHHALTNPTDLIISFLHAASRLTLTISDQTVTYSISKP